MSTPWPPPPDLHSIRELVRAADPEGHIAEGSAADEYEPEEDAIFAAIAEWPTAQITAPNLIPVIEQVWRNSFAHDHDALAASRPALTSLAEQIARFFGPEAQPQVRGRST
ncbi:MAG TPA: hypothetical protein VHU44_02380 [Acidobacteriaceae bacterium]|jgi:hypothetical protein|nr:hypothetical protein [Acidobacteriaceae bacterium]